MNLTAAQIKGRIKNIANKTNADPRLLMRIYIKSGRKPRSLHQFVGDSQQFSAYYLGIIINIKEVTMSDKTKKIIEEVNATMSLENMPLSEKDKTNIELIVTGKLTVDEVINNIKLEYAR